MNRYGGLDPASGLTHRAITPQLLAGLTGIDLALCRAFHFTLFGLLEDVGAFGGLVATSELFASADERQMPAADRWLFGHPAPAPDGGSRPTREAVDAHSLALAAALGANPSLTFGSTTSVAAVLLDELLDTLLDTLEPVRIVFDSQVEALTSVARQFVSDLRDVARVIGAVRVWAATDAETDPVDDWRVGDRTYVCLYSPEVLRCPS